MSEKKEYKNLEEIKEDFKDIKDLRTNYSGDLIIMSRADYIALGGKREEFVNGIREDVDDNTPITRCVNCGGEVIDEWVYYSERGYVDNDGDFHPMNRSDDEHEKYTCASCGCEVGSFSDGSGINY